MLGGMLTAIACVLTLWQLARFFFVLLFLFKLLDVGSAAHVPKVAWRKAYDFAPSESHPHAGVEARDGGFLMCGDGQDYTHKDPSIDRYVYVLKVDADGNVEWRLTLGTIGWYVHITRHTKTAHCKNVTFAMTSSMQCARQHKRWRGE